MGVLDSELVNIDSDIKNAQAIKNTVLEVLAKNGIINDEDREIYLSDYQIIVITACKLMFYFTIIVNLLTI